jgi:serine/threonine protein kinase
MQTSVSNDREKELFLRRAEIQATIEHDALVGFRGWVPPDGPYPPAILTEFMARGSLQSMIDAERNDRAPTDWDETRMFIALYGTAVGMMVLHQKGIIHGCLRPDNILLNNNLEPKITNFGLSKVTKPCATRLPWMRYMAPEIFNEFDRSFAIDVCSFGILVYVCITLMDPFPGVSDRCEIEKKLSLGERPMIPNWVTKKWRALMTMCWSQEPYFQPTFEEIVSEMGSADFANKSIDKVVLIAYMKRILPADFDLWRSAAAPFSPSPAWRDHLERMKDSCDSAAAVRYASRL